MFRTVLTCLVLLFVLPLFAQLPQGISYQAVARNSDGQELVNENLFVLISIRESATNGPISWQEEHSVSTNDFGLFQLIIGNGSSTGVGTSNTFSAISWADSDHFLQVELDPGDGIYELMGITQLLSVPYALVAGRALNVDDADADPTNELVQSMSIVDQQLVLEQSTGSISVDLGEAIPDGDNIVGNESLTLIQLQGTLLNIVESGQAYSVELESLSEDDDWQRDGPGVIYNLTDAVGIGTADPESFLHVEGSVSHKVDFHNTDETLFLGTTHHVVVCDVSIGNRELALPPAANAEGREYIIKKISTSLGEGEPILNSLTITPNEGETIDRSAVLLLDSTFREEVTIVSDGSEWWIISRSKND
jgi:hypothetical protein